MKVGLEQIAKTAHAVHLAYCEEVGLNTQPEWGKVDETHKAVVINSVEKIITGTVNTVEDSHDNFIKMKHSQGWVFGEEYNIDKLTNPRMVHFSRLTDHQRIKERLFFECVKSFKL